jgi:trigger factor
VDLTDLPEKGAPLSFSIEVGILPHAELGDWKGVEVGRREPDVDKGQVDGELDRIRESLASLETVDRPAAKGDFVVIDFVGAVDGEPFEGGESRGYLLELGSGRLLEGFEDQLEGAAAEESREVNVKFPDEYQAAELAGKDAVFAVDVKEVKEKRLPALDDDLALEAGGYDTLDELRTEIETRLREADERAIESEFREAAVDAAAGASKVEIPHELVHAKAHEMWHRTARRLQQQGLDPASYLQLTGKTEEELVTEAEPEAETALKRESVLAAVIEAEGIDVSDDEVLDALRQVGTAQAGGKPPSEKSLQRSLKKAKSQGTDEVLREDIAMRKAVDLIVEHAKPIAAKRAEAREKLWTPEKEKDEQSGQIWTPGS